MLVGPQSNSSIAQSEIGVTVLPLVYGAKAGALVLRNGCHERDCRHSGRLPSAEGGGRRSGP